MPVLATMAIIALLRSDELGPTPFFDPEELRDMLTGGLEGVADEELAHSLEIADQLESVIVRYRASVEESLNAYVAELAEPSADAADLIAQLQSHDRERSVLMQDIIDTRQRLMTLLDDELWEAVF
jgi:hypothetical protein